MGGWKMIKLQGSRFTDILPENLASQLETQAFAYALGRQVERLCAWADRTRVYAAVSALPEEILDVLALELRTPAYDQSFSVEVKRALIEGTMTFYTSLGTPAAADRILEIIFSDGRIEEWYEYGGEPHHFRAYIEMTGRPVTQESLVSFRRILASVKRLSSWWDGTITITELDTEPVLAVAGLGTCISRTELPLRNPLYQDTPAPVSSRIQGLISIIQSPERPPAYRERYSAARGLLKSSLTITALPERNREESQ